MKMLFILLSVLAVSSCTSNQSKPVTSTEGFTNTLKEMIAQHEGKILTPSTVDQINWSNIKVGYTFSYKSTSSRFPSEHQMFKLKSIDNNKYFFDYYENGNLSSTRSYYYENGVRFISINGGEFSNWGPATGGCSQFTVGVCEYEFSGRKKKQTISFKDGAWTYIRQGIGLSQITSHVVYDMNGIELFKRTSQASPSGVVDGWDQVVISSN